MALKVSFRAAPIFLLLLSSIWTAGIYLPLLYSFVSPSADNQHLIAALEGRVAARRELSSLVQEIVGSSGYLKHSIRVAAHYGASAEYKAGQPHTSKQTEFAYIAWFEKLPKPTILVVDVTQIDGTTLRFSIHESDTLSLVRVLLLPLLALGFCIYWFRLSRIRERRNVPPEPTRQLTHSKSKTSELPAGSAKDRKRR